MTCALQKMQMIVIPPCTDIALPHQIQRPYQFHSFKVCAVELRHHGLHLPAVKHSHQDSLDHIIVVMPQRDLIASQCLGMAVQIPSAHSCAKIARILLNGIHRIEDIALKDLYGDPQRLRITFDQRPVFLIISRIHHQKGQVKLHLPVRLDLLKQFRHQHGIFPAGDTYRDPVAFFDQFIFFARLGKGREQLLMEFLTDAQFRPLLPLFLIFLAIQPCTDITHIAFFQAIVIPSFQYRRISQFSRLTPDLAIKDQFLLRRDLCDLFRSRSALDCLRIHRDRPGQHPILPQPFIPYIDQDILPLRQRLQFFQCDLFHI